MAPYGIFTTGRLQLYVGSSFKSDRCASTFQGEESGVEILVNEPYTNGPGPGGTSTNGQYTHKIYHIGSHLPAWFKNLLPKSALSAEEKAWNAYPYTKTIFTCPFVDR